MARGRPTLFWVVRFWPGPAGPFLALSFPPYGALEDAEQAAAAARTEPGWPTLGPESASLVRVVHATTLQAAMHEARPHLDDAEPSLAVWHRVRPRFPTAHWLLPMPSQSMAPTLPASSILAIDTQARTPRRGAVVAFVPPARAPIGIAIFVQRVIGLPGETVSVHDGQVHVDSQTLVEPVITRPTPGGGAFCQVTLAEDEYYVLGDNRTNSADSRFWGPIQTTDIIGTVTGV
jgi:signal peptidase I